MFDFYISDYHFGHYNVIKYGDRPFSYYGLDKIQILPRKLKNYLKRKATTKMNEFFIAEWNKKVKKHHKVLVCGDFSFLNLKDTEKILKRLNGEKYLIKGNHDSKSNKSYIDIGFKEVHNELVFKYEDVEILFSHYPYLNQTYNKTALFRPNILKPFNSKKPETSLSYEELINTDYVNQDKFVRYAYSYNIKDEKIRSIVLKMIRSHVGTRPINEGNILARGHSHDTYKRRNNEINLCVEAHDYSPISHDEFMNLVKKCYDYLFNDDVKEIEDLSYLREALRLKLIKNKNKKLDTKIRKRLKEIDQRKNLITLKEIIENDPYFKLKDVPKEITSEYIELNKKNNTYIPKEKLIKNECYYGCCRNASFAIWNGEEFIYLRSKFSDKFLESIKCLEDDDGYDIFIPHEKAFKELKEVKELYDYYNRR